MYWSENERNNKKNEYNTYFLSEQYAILGVDLEDELMV